MRTLLNSRSSIWSLQVQKWCFFCKELSPDIEKLAESKAWNMYKELEKYFAIQSPIKEFL